MAKVEVREAASPDEREALFAFRYKVYVEEFGMTDRADHSGRTLRDGYDDEGINYALFEDGEVVGSLRILLLDRLSDPAPLIEKFGLEPAIAAFGAGAIGTTSRFMVAPHLRSSMAIFRLIRAAFVDPRSAAVRLNYGDCSPHLVPFYEQLGYRRYTTGFDDTAYGYKLPIVMLVRDREFLTTVRSPLARLLADGEDDAEARAWFARTYPDYVHVLSAAFLPEDMFFDLLAERVSSDPLHAVTLLRGLDREQARRFLTRATVVKVGPGDRIVRKGDRDNTLYALLAGLAEVRPNGSGGPPVAMLAAGDTFGEIGFLTTVARTADVVACAPCEVLVLSGEFMHRFIAQEPAIGATVMHNLARELAARLAVTTHRAAIREAEAKQSD